jgi:hypothetical protein
MKKYIVILAMLVLSMCGFGVSVDAKDLVWQDIGRGNLNLNVVLINPDNPSVIYIGSSNAVLKTENGGLSWESILSIKGQNRAVNFLLFDPQNKNCLYAATGNGLFYSANQGKSWARIFQGKNYLENECTAVSILASRIYLGTKAGLFVSKDKGRSWSKEAGKIGKSDILGIACDLKGPDYIYVACVDGVFKTENNGGSWERTFVANPTEDSNDREEKEDDQDEGGRNSYVRYISIDPNNPNYLYLATSRGVYKNQDRGRTWQFLSDYGLLNRDTKFLLLSNKSEVYAVTKSGIFKYEDERWQELSLRLAAGEINFLSLDRADNIYAACDKGLFKANLEYVNENSQINTIALYYKDEPGIREIQGAAIKYAEVEPEKIKQWRAQAAKKAWLPQVSLGLDRNATDLWHWESGSTTKSEDDMLRKGRDNIDWDVTLSWDLGELIWNDDQTSIDVRSKLMVQLREDILDEVTKLYFERIRIKMELDGLSIEDRKKRLDKELRIQELTSYLDALTGSYFSKCLYKN